MALTSADLTAALSEHERRSVGDRRAEGLTIGERLYSSPRVHRLIPDRGAIAIAWLVGTVQWLLSKGLRAEAVQYMSLLLEGTPRSHEARSLGRRHLIESSAGGLALWRPRMLRGARLDGISNLEQVERKGAGAILLSMHVGANHLGNSQPLLRRGLRVHVLGGEEWLFPQTGSWVTTGIGRSPCGAWSRRSGGTGSGRAGPTNCARPCCGEATSA